MAVLAETLGPVKRSSGPPPRVAGRQLDDVALFVVAQDLTGGVDWTMESDRHALIVHLDGVAECFSAEFDGSPFVPSVPGGGDEGMFWIVPAGGRYVSGAHGRGTLRYVELSLTPAALGALVGSDGPEALHPRLGDGDAVVNRDMRRLAALVEREDDVARMMAEEIAGRLLTHLWRTDRAISESHGRAGPLSGAAVARLRAYVDENLGDGITVGDLARVAGLSERALVPAFRASFHTTPAQYVIAVRLERAKRLLRESAEDITTIAVETGFSSHAHLTTAFKSRTGMTPSRFRSETRG